MRITVKSCKAKARSLQNKIVEDLLKKYPVLTSNDVKPSIMGESGIDIKLSESARKLFPYGTECKNQESLSIWKCIKQSEENAIAEKLRPILIFKRNRSDVYVTLKWEEFLKML
jgi:hypothetical protein